MWTGAIQDAFSFLTIVPFPCPLSRWRGPIRRTRCPLTDSTGSVTLASARAGAEATPTQRMGRAMAWFPLVGAFVGGVGAAVAMGAGTLWSAPLAALLALGVMAGLTGGIHLDGFADTADGLAVPRPAQEAHRIMTDPRLGAIGTMGLLFLLLAKWILIQSIAPVYLGAALVTACGMGRWALVLSAQSFRYIPGESGIGRLVTDLKAPTAVWIATLVTFAGIFYLCELSLGLLLVALTLGVVAGLNRFFVSRFGGVTGDTLGAVNEVVEAGVLMLFALR